MAGTVDGWTLLITVEEPGHPDQGKDVKQVRLNTEMKLAMEESDDAGNALLWLWWNTLPVYGSDWDTRLHTKGACKWCGHGDRGDRGPVVCDGVWGWHHEGCLDARVASEARRVGR